MKPENITALSDQQLLQKSKEIKTNKIIKATIIGFTIGIVIYSVAKKGLGFPSFLPLLLLFIMFRNAANNKIVEKQIQEELKSRNLK